MYYWVFMTLYVFLTIIMAQFLIDEQKELKILFYMIMLLLFISFNNIYFSIKYYIKLRTNKGIKGDTGDPGDSGQDGSNGVCIMSKGCGIINCRKLINDELLKRFPDYKKIKEQVDNNIKLNDFDQKIYNKLNNYINILIPKCENYESEESGDSINEFRKIIEKTLQQNN